MDATYSVVSTKLCLIRHGETAWNAAGRLQGQIDVPLSPVGAAQARATAGALVGTTFAAIYASDLLRARQTAEAAARVLALPLHFMAGLRERHYGVFQSLTYAEARSRYPAEYARFEAREADFDFLGGESLTDFAARVVACVATIAARHAGEQVLVVTHGGVLDVLHRQASGKPLSTPRDFAIPNAALNWMSMHDGVWSLLSWADTRHLTETLDELPG